MYFGGVPMVKPQHLQAVLQQIVIEPSKVRETDGKVVAVVEPSEELSDHARLP
ncbi:hypothetical protein NK8_85820 (plasmid) [Caballeronia sp. NK8]|nr:hypothetical protein NK8_85820 [Caballeronia sp. NK8]